MSKNLIYPRSSAFISGQTYPRHFRLLSNLLLSLLLMAASVWGGCVSCSQFFMFAKDEKSCCKKSGECEKPGKPKPVNEECSKLPFAVGSTNTHELQVSFVAFTMPSVAAPAYLTIAAGIAAEPDTGPPQYSPPPLFLKHSALLI